MIIVKDVIAIYTMLRRGDRLVAHLGNRKNNQRRDQSIRIAKVGVQNIFNKNGRIANENHSHI